MFLWCRNRWSTSAVPEGPMVPWLVAACLHAVKRLHAQGRKLATKLAPCTAWSQAVRPATVSKSVSAPSHRLGMRGRILTDEEGCVSRRYSTLSISPRARRRLRMSTAVARRPLTVVQSASQTIIAASATKMIRGKTAIYCNSLGPVSRRLTK